MDRSRVRSGSARATSSTAAASRVATQLEPTLAASSPCRFTSSRIAISQMLDAQMAQLSELKAHASDAKGVLRSVSAGLTAAAASFMAPSYSGSSGRGHTSARAAEDDSGESDMLPQWLSAPRTAPSHLTVDSGVVYRDPDAASNSSAVSKRNNAVSARRPPTTLCTAARSASVVTNDEQTSAIPDGDRPVPVPPPVLRNGAPIARSRRAPSVDAVRVCGIRSGNAVTASSIPKHSLAPVTSSSNGVAQTVTSESNSNAGSDTLSHRGDASVTGTATLTYVAAPSRALPCEWVRDVHLPPPVIVACATVETNSASDGDDFNPENCDSAITIDDLPVGLSGWS
jgi:hypothetical protein